MKIECILRRPVGSKVEFEANFRGSSAPRTTYHFKPLDASDADSAHVADVTYEAHRDRLLGIPEGYRLFGNGETVAVTKPASNASMASSTRSIPAADPARVEALRGTTVKELKATINTYTPDELRAAAASERERTDDKPRASWLEVVAAHLGE